MTPDRTFYGGVAPGAAHGEIAPGHYDGPESRLSPPWKCPACKAEQTGPLEQGCVSCGAGKPGFHVGVQAPSPAAPPPAAPSASRWPVDLPRPRVQGIEPVYAAGDQWAGEHPDGSLTEAFVAGYLAAKVEAARLARAVAVVGPSVDGDFTADRRPARTILAALSYFRDQILSQDPEEARSGEWCSLAETDALIQQYKESL